MTGDSSGPAGGSFRALGPGSRIGDYLIEAQIGAGGMALVFRARDKVLRRPAAVKVIAPSMTDDEEFRSRFLRESRAAATVGSLHIIPVYAAGEAEGLLYVATRFVAGGDLARLLREAGGQLAPERAVPLVEQVASALDAAHAAGLVHRDVKPGNILVDAFPERPEHVYLTDFGISKGMQSTGLTAAGQFIGTPDYAAPEQIESAGVDGRTDQYALACLAFALLTGVPPFRRPDAAGTLFAHLNDPVPSVTAQRPELPLAVNDVIARALAKSSADRYGRCGEFAASMREALLPARSPAGPAAFPVPSPGPAPADGARLALPQSPAGGMPWRKAFAAWAAGSATVLVAGVVAAVAYLALPSSSGLGPTPGVTTSSSRPDTGDVIASHVLADDKYGFNGPTGIAADGGHVWIANYRGNTVTELNASNGTLIRTLSGDDYRFNGPNWVAADGGRIWITNARGDSVTELNASNGALIRTLTDSKYGFNYPNVVTADGSRIWIANYRGNTVTELNANDGALIRTLTHGKYGFNGPTGIASASGHVWIANNGDDTVTELNANDGALIRILSESKYGFKAPNWITADGGRIWITNASGNTVTELNANDGTLIRRLTDSKYGFNDPNVIAADGTHIWVGNYNGNTVTELNADNGTWIRTLDDSAYELGSAEAVVAEGTHIWIANYDGDTVTRLTIG